MNEKEMYLTVATFYALDGAESGFKQLQMDKKLPAVRTAVVLKKDHKNRVTMQDVGFTPRKGATSGLVVGTVAAVVTGGASLGLAALGGILGHQTVKHRRGSKVTPNLTEQLTNALSPGSSIILIVTDKPLPNEVMNALETMDGDVMTATLSAETLQQLDEHADEAYANLLKSIDQATNEKTAVPYPRIKVIINPAAGQDEPILNTLNDVFGQYGVEWDVALTRKFGDATEFAATAVAEGYDLVVGYGGDGTQMEIANGVKGSQTPMAILPGGTGNAMAFELGIPRELRGAAELLCRSYNKKAVDLGKIGDRFFMLRTYTGPQQEQIASREMKDKYGVMAYPVAAMRTMAKLPIMNHRLTIDGKVYEEDAFICFIFNAGSMGGLNLPKPVEIDPGDGVLDVVLINKTLRSLGASVVSYTLDTDLGSVHHWQGREITVETDEPQAVWIDGEAYGETPFTATLMPSVVQIVCP